MGFRVDGLGFYGLYTPRQTLMLLCRRASTALALNVAQAGAEEIALATPQCPKP